jgi:hypothetical protein
MTDTNQAPTPSEVLDANELVNSLIATMPALGPLNRVLPNVAALVSFHRSGVFTAREALDQLEVAGISEATTRPIIDTMEQMALKELAVLAGQFAEKTGTTLNPATFDVRPRTVEEVQEQGAYQQRAIELKAQVEALRGFLFPQAPQAPLNPVQTWIKGARAKAEEIIYQPVSEQVSGAAPGWKTPPVLNESDPVVKHVLKQIGVIETIKAKLVTLAAVSKQLSNMGFDTKAILDKAEELANEQIMQATLVTKLAVEDQDYFIARTNAIASVRAIAKEARDYLDSAK